MRLSKESGAVPNAAQVRSWTAHFGEGDPALLAMKARRLAATSMAALAAKVLW
jgi:hypothetical protein